MNEAVIKYYRKLLRTRFEYAGSLENPSMYLDTVISKVRICNHTSDFMHLYVNIVNNTIDDIKYMCVCDPTANVAIEILCGLAKGKTLEEATGITEKAFFQFMGTEDEELAKKAKGLLELLNTGITQYKAQKRRPSLDIS
jgi:NifU-like protein involved in Fe-S cluster formation